MRAVAIVGFKNSGKSFLVNALARALKGKGLKVGIVKHAHRALKVSEKDKPAYSASGGLTVLSDRETASLHRGVSDLAGALSAMDADLALVEGFKGDRTMPRIVCCRDPKDKKRLSLGLEIGFMTTGKLTSAGVRKLASAARKKAFKLPGTDCGKCGFKTCYALAKEIVRGKKRPEDCDYASAAARVRIAGKNVPMKSFVDAALVNVVKGFLRSLKGGNASGRIEITIGMGDEG